MAKAIPVGQPEVKEEVKPQDAPVVESPAVAEIDHSSFIGKDHPLFGTWVESARGWKQNH